MRNRTWIVALALLLLARVASAQCGLSCVLVNDASDTLHPSCSFGGVGTCSLRDALTIGAAPTVHFAIGSGHQTITLMSDLPDLAGGTIDGTTQPGYAGAPLIEIHRGDLGTATHGLRKSVPTSSTESPLVVKALVINHFNGNCTTCGGIILSDPSDQVRQGGNVIQGCYIGTDWTGAVAEGNIPAGIEDNSLGDNTYGGTTAAERNVISGNSAGISIARRLVGYSVQSVIQGNYIGTNAAGTAALPNVYGILVGSPYPGFSPGILVGGSTPGAGNLFAGGGNGVQIDVGGVNAVIQGNTFGLDATGLNPLPVDVGIILAGEDSATVLNNVIVASTSGISINQEPASSITTHGTIIRGNYLGTDVTGNRAFHSGGSGITIGPGAPNNIIGGSAAGQGNVIGGFNLGIYKLNAGGVASTGNVIQGNKIGIGVNGSPIPNAIGIAAYTADSSGVAIGGINSGEANIIAFNTQSGIAVVLGTGNKVSGNSIYGNGGLGIDLNADGVTPNDACDGDTGANNLQNFPVITAVTPGTSTRIQGTLNSKANTVYRLEFFANASCDPSGYGEGQAFIGYLDVTTDAGCNASFDVTYSYATNPGQPITATATDPSGNTSEFCACVPTGHFFTVPPCRVADTRNAPGPSGGPALAANAIRTFPVTGICGIPSSATAAAINMAVFLPSDGGDLRAFPAGGATPLASSLNFRPGIIRANNALVPLGIGGQISIQCDMPPGSGTTHFFFDVYGYFQ